MLKSPLRFVFSAHEASVHASRSRKHHRIASYLNERNPHAAKRVRAAIDESLRYLTLFPRAGRAQTTEGVRKLVTRKYAYIVYYSMDDIAGEIAILAVKHPAQRREHDDA